MLAGSRPTAVNLVWALEQMRAEPIADAGARAPPGARSSGAGGWRAHAAGALRAGTRALTHCNAGGLATGGYGSAVGALRAAWEHGLLAHVWVDETRPLLQGARLTAWELEGGRSPHAVIADNAGRAPDGQGRGADSVVIGADRIAANGDAANKIGTYGLAVARGASRASRFYVVAPTLHGRSRTRRPGRRSPSRSATRRK